MKRHTFDTGSQENSHRKKSKAEEKEVMSMNAEIPKMENKDAIPRVTF